MNVILSTRENTNLEELLDRRLNVLERDLDPDLDLFPYEVRDLERDLDLERE